MLRTDHIYPRTVIMPLEPRTPHDSDMGELSLSMSAPLPSGIEPLAPSPIGYGRLAEHAMRNAWPYTDEPRVLTDDEIESMAQKRPPLPSARRRPRSRAWVWAWVLGAFVLGFVLGGLLT